MTLKPDAIIIFNMQFLKCMLLWIIMIITLFILLVIIASFC